MTVLLLLILLGAPGYSFWLLVPGIDPIGRLVVASLASMIAVSIVSEAMLAGGIWSPPAGFAAVLTVSVLLALYARFRTRLHRKPAPAPDILVAAQPRPKPAAPDPDSAGDDDWIYDA